MKNQTETQEITFDEGTALFDILDMLTDMLREATREYDYANEEVYRVAKDPNSSAMRIQNAVEYQLRMAERVSALGQARDRAQYIFNGMILEAAQLPYFN